MANKLQKLFSNKDLSLSLNFSFDNEATRQSFISAIKKATEEGITIRPEGTVTVNSAIRNEKSIFYTSGSNKLTQIEISPSKEEFSLDIPTELGSFKLMMKKYYTTTHMIWKLQRMLLYISKPVFSNQRNRVRNPLCQQLLSLIVYNQKTHPPFRNLSKNTVLPSHSFKACSELLLHFNPRKNMINICKCRIFSPYPFCASRN